MPSSVAPVSLGSQTFQVFLPGSPAEDTNNKTDRDAQRARSVQSGQAGEDQSPAVVRVSDRISQDKSHGKFERGTADNRC